MQKKYGTVSNAEDKLGLTVEYYIGGDPSTSPTATPEKSPTKHGHLSLTKPEQIGLATACVSTMSSTEKIDFIEKIISALAVDSVFELVKKLVVSMLAKNLMAGPMKLVENILEHLTKLDDSTVGSFLNGLTNKFFLQQAKHRGVSTNPADFVTLSLQGMTRLESGGKTNLIYKFSQCVGGSKEGNKKESPLPMNRMPFGLIDYTIQFFTCTDVRQLRISEDYRLWLQTMTTEFPSRFHRLLAGPMWSGQKEVGNPEKARANVPAPSLVTIWKHNNKEQLKFDPKAGFQMAALDELKRANPDGRFWLKLDGTDVKTGIQESMKGKWNGDVDLLDGKLERLRKEYDLRLEMLTRTKGKKVVKTCLLTIVSDLKEDVVFLGDGLKEVWAKYRRKYDAKNTPEEVLKGLNWEVVEYHTLLGQAQNLMQSYQEALQTGNTDEEEQDSDVHHMKSLAGECRVYLRNTYKKRREAADHIVVWMLSDEKRSIKPYALPVGYIPCKTLRDQHVRDLNVHVKREMKKRGLKLAGVSSDGEYCTLRSQGDTRPLNLWQLIHDAKESVKHMRKQTLLDKIVLLAVDANGTPVVQQPCAFIPDEVIMRLHQLRMSGMTLEDAVTYIRGKLVPDGYTPYPFRANNSETLLDKLRSIAATYQFRHTVQYWKDRGVDFSLYLYVPEIDPITEEIRHDRSDHNHVLKRIGKSTREGHNKGLNFDAFDAALKDAKSGLTHAALVGLQKQSVKDAERLLSVHVVKSMRDQGYHDEAKYVEVICNWHAASDGRGLTQLQHCWFNYQMLGYILDELMPWHVQNYDLSTIDVNRPWAYVRGFSRETVVEITTNVESQEYRRRENHIIGYAEHPRAGGTDDLENFFSIIHRILGSIFTVKQFKEVWNQVVREFTKKMDSSLPFYYHTLNERYTEEELPSFDESPVCDDGQVELRTHPLRLNRLRINSREDGAIFTSGRSFLPVRDKRSIRDRIHRPEAVLPPPPNVPLDTQ